MNQEPRIEELAPKKLIGISLDMSRANDRTPELWRSFMPRRGNITHRVSTDFISMQVYPDVTRINDPEAGFTKWAVVEVETQTDVPEGMSTYDLEGGTYAVFIHNGPATDPGTFIYIFRDWLPASSCNLDNREHFELLPEDYNPMDPNAREEIWIPVRPK